MKLLKVQNIKESKTHKIFEIVYKNFWGGTITKFISYEKRKYGVCRDIETNDIMPELKDVLNAISSFGNEDYIVNK